MDAIFRLYERLLDLCGQLPGYLVGLVSLGIAFDVALRNLGLGSLPWILELTEYALFSLTFLGTAYVLRKGRHVRVDIIVDALQPAKRRLVALLANTIILVLVVVFLYYGIKAVHLAYTDQSVLRQHFSVPEWWPGPACTGNPGGLSITSRSASS